MVLIFTYNIINKLESISITMHNLNTTLRSTNTRLSVINKYLKPEISDPKAIHKLRSGKMY